MLLPRLAVDPDSASSFILDKTEGIDPPHPDLSLSPLGRPSPSKLQEVHIHSMLIALPTDWALESDYYSSSPPRAFTPRGYIPIPPGDARSLQ